MITSIAHDHSIPATPHFVKRIWPEDDLARIQTGIRAKYVEEKWNVFGEEDVVFLLSSA